MSAGDEPEPIILTIGDQIDFYPIGQSPVDAAYLELQVQQGFELWRQLYEGNWPAPNWPDPNAPDRHERLRPKPRLDANARVSHYPLVPVDYIIPKNARRRAGGSDV